MTEVVLWPWISGIRSEIDVAAVEKLVRRLALVVLGQSHIDTTCDRTGLDVLGTIHRGCAEQIGSRTTFDHHLGLTRETVT